MTTSTAVERAGQEASTLAAAQQRRRAAARRKAQLDLVLRYARARGRVFTRRSNRAWLVSAVAAAGGTLMAVSDLRRATMWQDVIDALEDARVDAVVELRLAEEAARRAGV